MPVDYEIGTLLKEHTWINVLYRFSKRQNKWGSYLEWIRKWMKHDCSANTQETKALLLGRSGRKEESSTKSCWGDYAQRGQFFRGLTLELLNTTLCSSESLLWNQGFDSAGEWHNAKCLVPFADGFNTAERVNVATNEVRFYMSNDTWCCPGRWAFVPYN